ncbi:MAG: RES family NAD+ phosphorylase [Verrucomicrobiota bacterium]
MNRAWRIVRESLGSTAFDGEGARLFGGRWNSRGTRMVYTSATLSLAALETLVHLNPPVAFKYVAISIDFDEALVATVDAMDLPPDWNEEPPPPSAAEIGDRWVKESRSAVLELPSVIIPAETNYLINPAHSDFKRIHIGKPLPFSFDPRLI